MIEIRLDGRNMDSKEKAHLHMKRQLNLPDYYGGNLDALWDILTTIDKPIKINIINKESLIDNLGDYGKSIIKVFKDAEKENNNLKLEIMEDVNHMKVTTLIENNSSNREDLDTEHGLSVYIEVDGKNILFDTGQSGNFIDNAKKLGIDLKNLDYVVISHGHYDHSGGFERLIKDINPDIKLYIGQGFFNEKYDLISEDNFRFIGNSFNEDYLKENDIPIKYINEDTFKITENLLVFTNFNRKEEYENTNQTLYLKEDGKYNKDMFYDEISLGLKTNEGLFVIVGCSHPGIINILDTISQRTNMDIHGVIGGTHLVKEDDEQINKVIEYLKEKNIKIVGACHCTGKQGETMLSQQLEENFINNNTGDVLKL